MHALVGGGIMASEIDSELRELARRRVRERNGLIIHALTYVVVNAGIVTMWMVAGHGYPWFAWLMLFWGVGLIAHAITYGIGPGSPREGRAVERELRRLKTREQH